MILAILFFSNELSKNLRTPRRAVHLMPLMPPGLGVEKSPSRHPPGPSTLGKKPVRLETRPSLEGAPATARSEAAPIDVWPTPAVSPVAAKSDELDAIKKAVDDAASVGGGLWLSYLFVLFYLAVAAGAVTHADLFLEKAVKLPFLNVELPLLAFFALAPILFLFVHAYTLVHLVFLTDKAKRYHQALYEQIGDKAGLSTEELAKRKARRDGFRRQLPSNIFVQFLAGAPNVRAGAFGWLLRAIVWSTLVVAPILLLLLFQLQFLPFHNSFITWTQRIALFADLALLWWLWRKIMGGREPLTGHPRAKVAWGVVGIGLTICVVLFSWTVATFPGERQEGHLPDWRFISTADPAESPTADPEAPTQIPYALAVRLPKNVSLHDWVFNSAVDPTARRRWLPFSSTLVLTGFNLLEDLGVDDPKKVEWRSFVFRARGRDLKGGIFDFADLGRVDFAGAHLEGASLRRTQLVQASFDGALLTGAVLDGARLHGASFRSAQIVPPGGCAQLQGASLDFAQLQGASLIGARLQGASLEYALLEGASLESAQLQGASLDFSQLQGSMLTFAQLQGASLGFGTFEGASLQSAQLQGASLESAASLEATDLGRTSLWRTNRPRGPPDGSAIRLPNDDNTWQPIWRDKHGQIRPWDEEAYHAVRSTIAALPSGSLRDKALERIKSLDCSRSDEALPSCNPSAAPPPQAAEWRRALESASVDETSYARALAKTLKELVCSGGDDAIRIVGGEGFQRRLLAAETEAVALIAELMNKDSKDCPVSATLPNDDRAKLLLIKRRIEEAAAAQKSETSDTPYSP
jgi:uncharacterized protein YjbI with pentapeptide repeats